MTLNKSIKRLDSSSVGLGNIKEVRQSRHCTKGKHKKIEWLRHDISKSIKISNSEEGNTK